VKQVVIENPVINSPFREPNRHFRFTDEGITNEVIEGRRTSSYFIPIAQPRKKKGQKQLVFDTEWTQDRIEKNVLRRVKVNQEPGDRRMIHEGIERYGSARPIRSHRVAVKVDRSGIRI